MLNLKKNQIIILALASLFVFLIIYSPHFITPFPIHIDEWHHITESIKLRQGEPYFGWNALEFGFHFFLMLLSYIVDIVLNYQFLPAFWAVFSALALFFISYKLTNKFSIAIFAMIFFASIKSNVNILGIWFFVPLTFSIPFIFLYIYFFTQGFEKQDKKYFLYSLIIMIFLIFTHAPSLLFSLPLLLISALLYPDYLKKHYKFFLSFLLIPIIGIIFYKFIINNTWSVLINSLINNLQFKYGWGVFERDNTFPEIYSLIGYFFAIIGIISIFLFQKNYKKYLPYILWPVLVLISIIIFKITKVSYLSPYQRNIYYFIISLPFLSAIGLYYFLKIISSIAKDILDNINHNKEVYIKIINIIIILIIMAFIFKSYFNIPYEIRLYKAIEKPEYFALKNLSFLPKSRIIAPLYISVGVFPVSGHTSLATPFFYGNSDDVTNFYAAENCTEKQELIKQHNVSYVISGYEINCSWNQIYNQSNISIYNVMNYLDTS